MSPTRAGATTGSVSVMHKSALLLVLPLLLVACSTEPDGPKPVTDDTDPAALVTERYGDCLADLDASPPVTAADGTTVTSIIEGAILTWDVGMGNENVLTFPADIATQDALESVGC